jgi:hypothetical protein
MMMNTLPQAITDQFYTDSQDFHNLRQHWRELMTSPRKHELAATHHLLYLILLGKDWRKGFTGVTNQRKLDNGAYHGWILFRAIAALHRPSCKAELLAPFDGLVKPQTLDHVRRLVPIQYAYKYRPDQFSTADYPFEAYYIPVTPETDSPNA